MSTRDNSASFFKLLARSIPTEEYLQLVVTLALEHQRQSKSKHPSLKRLRTAINNSGMEIEGWRSKAAASAPTPRLVAPVAELMQHSNDLAEAVISVWADAHEALRLVATHHIDQLDPEIRHYVDGDGQDTDRWDPVILNITIGDIVTSLYQDDIYLMLCYLSGLLPPMGDEYPEHDEPEQADDLASLGGTVFAEWMGHLDSLPHDAPEWDRIKAFNRSVGHIIVEKDAERERLQEIAININDVKTRFAEELEYLQRDIDSWAALSPPHSQINQIDDLVWRLLDSLADYQPLRERAPNRSEEAARDARRRELESTLDRLIDEIEERMSVGDAPPGPDGSDDGPAAEAAAETVSAPMPPGKSKPKRARSRKPAAPKAETNGKSNVSLHRRASEMSASGRREPRSVAPHEADAGETDEAPAADAPPVTAPEPQAVPPPDVPTVARAVYQAKVSFPEALRFAPNSKSDTDTPFENPTACWMALEWLATTYRDSRLGKTGVTDLKQSLYETCRWDYRKSQSPSTMGEYPEHYAAKYDGRNYALEEHIGKGGNKDPRHTIRIAFAWDKDLEVVIIGYIGQHQRTAVT